MDSLNFARVLTLELKSLFFELIEVSCAQFKVVQKDLSGTIVLATYDQIKVRQLVTVIKLPVVYVAQSHFACYI